MARTMPPRLVALSSSAVAAIYFAGLVATRSGGATYSVQAFRQAVQAALTRAAA